MKDKKFKSASFNNRKKQLEVVYTSGRRITIHYSSLGLKTNLKETWVDSETHGHSVGLRLMNGRVDYLPYDQPLAIVKDSDFLLQCHIERITAGIKEVLKRKKISKRYLAEQLHTSDNQIHRLLNPRIVNKNLSQLYQIATLLGLQFEIHLKAA